MFIRINHSGQAIHASEIHMVVIDDGERLVLHCPNYGTLEVAKELVAIESEKLHLYMSPREYQLELIDALGYTLDGLEKALELALGQKGEKSRQGKEL